MACGRVGRRTAPRCIWRFYLPLLIDDVAVARSLTMASYGVGAVLFFSAAVLLPQRWRGGSNAWQRAVAPVLWPGAIILAALSYYDASAFFADSVGLAPIWVFRIAFALIPFAFPAVLLRVRPALGGAGAGAWWSVTCDVDVRG